MSKLNHTPGPWQVSGGRSRVDAYGHMVGPDGLSIACVFYSDRTDADHIASLADARLIAQAWKIPDLEAQIASLTAENERLREALKAARDQFQFYADEHRSAGKTEKAQTNQAMADRCDAALQPKELNR